MKKIYIKPENVVVKLNTEQLVCRSWEDIKDTDATSDGGNPGDLESPSAGLAREVIRSRDAWEEW